MRVFQDIEISVREIRSSISTNHSHHYFELLYILKGDGVHTINNNRYQYQKGNLYLLTPEDTHSFKTDTVTHCCIIDFTKGLFSKQNRRQNDRAEISEFFASLEYIFHNHQNLKGNIIPGTQEATLTDALIMQLVKEKEQARIYNGIIIQNIVFLLLNLIARLIQENMACELKYAGSKDVIYEITVYIQQYIYKKELLKLENIAKQFHKTPDHLNRLFKKQTGITLKAYINRYKLNLIETRLRYSDLTISEIADEMGFTDESHLNKVFKSAFCQTAKAYRNSVATH